MGRVARRSGAAPRSHRLGRVTAADGYSRRVPETTDPQPICGRRPRTGRERVVGMGRAAAVTGCITAVLAVALAGCGSSYTRRDFVQRADGICLATTRAVRSLPSPAFTGTAEQQRRSLGRYLARVAPLVQKQARRLSALPRPPGGSHEQKSIGRWLTAAHESADLLAHLAYVARTGDASAVADADAQLAAVPVVHLAANVGARSCAGPGATVVHPLP